MKRIFLIALAAAAIPVFLMVSGIQAEETPEPDQPLIEHARARALPVAKALMGTLEGRLKEAMGKGGPVAAIGVCREQALALTKAVRKEKDIAYLKRVGVRIRNPENAPDAHEQRALEHFLVDGHKAGEYPQDWVDTVELPDGSMQLRYYKAIPLQARCLPCHGPEERMPEVIRKALNDRYPGDEARGFELGDLRGLLVFGLEADTAASE